MGCSSGLTWTQLRLTLLGTKILIFGKLSNQKRPFKTLFQPELERRKKFPRLEHSSGPDQLFQCLPTEAHYLNFSQMNRASNFPLIKVQLICMNHEKN
jgi:hypothetical protein